MHLACRWATPQMVRSLAGCRRRAAAQCSAPGLAARVGPPARALQLGPPVRAPQGGPLAADPQGGPLAVDLQVGPLAADPQVAPLAADPQVGPLAVGPRVARAHLASDAQARAYRRLLAAPLARALAGATPGDFAAFLRPNRGAREHHAVARAPLERPQARAHTESGQRASARSCCCARAPQLRAITANSAHSPASRSSSHRCATSFRPRSILAPRTPP